MELTKMKFFSLSSDKIAPYIFIAPGIIILASLIIYPTIMALITSINTSDGWSIYNYIQLLQSSLMWGTLKNTCIFALTSVTGHYILGLLIALLINNKIYAKGFFRVCFLIPWMFPAVVPGIIWRWMLHGQFGILNSFLVSLGVIDKYIPWLASPKTALGFVIVANIWRGFPLFVAVLLAGLQTIPQSLYDAAKVDGSNWFLTFWYITLPQLSGVSITMILVDIIWQFNNFPIVQIMTQGGPGNSSEVLATLIYKNAFNYNDYQFASAIGILLLIIMLIPGSLYVKHILKQN